MKKSRVVGCLFLVFLMLSGCTHNSRYLLNGETYVDETSGLRYAPGIVNGWRPISGEQELLGFAGTGTSMPVYGFLEDAQRAVIYVGKYGSNEVQPGYYHRTDLVFPSIESEEVSSVLYLQESDWEILMSPNSKDDLTTAVATNATDDQVIISGLTSIITNGQRIFRPLTAPDKEYGQVLSMQWVGIILLLSDSFPGIAKSLIVYSARDGYYLVNNVDANNMAECIELPTDLVKELCDIQP